MSNLRNDFPFSDEELKKAAGLVYESMLNSLPAKVEQPHTFSEAFEEKIDRLYAKQKARRSRHRFLRSAAAILAVVLIVTGVWLSTDTDAWADFRQWIRKVAGSNSIIYQYYGPSASEALPEYEITWLPEGYVFAFEIDEIPGMSKRIAYENDGKDMLFFIYGFMSEGQETTIIIGDSVVCESVTVAGKVGDIYYSDDGGSNVLNWFDNEAGISFGLQTNLGKEVMLRIAESITPVQ